MPPKTSFWAALARDRELYAEDGGWAFRAGFWVGATYRFGAHARQIRSRPLRFLAQCVHGAVSLPVRMGLGVVIPSNVDIGPGLRMPHPRNIFIYPGTRLGRNCSLYQEVTVGRGPVPGVPAVGDEVIVFPGGRVLGGVEVGDRSRVGANVVVSTNLAPDSLVSVAQPRVVDGARLSRIKQKKRPHPPAEE